MNRRELLQSTAALSTLALFPPRLARAEGGWRTFEIVTQIDVLQPEGATRIWVPAPLTVERSFQKPLGNAWNSSTGRVTFRADQNYGAGIVWAEWPADETPTLTVTSRVATRDIAVDLMRPGSAMPEQPAVLQKYLQPTALAPTDGIVKQTSDEIVKGARTPLDKTRAIYEWIVDNTYRNPETRGCGVGDIRFMLETKDLGGKCADLSALFVGLARAAGIPARDVYGIRVADSKLGYKSLGRSGDITKAQHCRAEVYLEGYGWVPMDPADVRKVVLEEDGGKPLNDPKVVAARQRLFGSWEMNWMAYNTASDLALPDAARGPVPFLMYPQCETSEGRVDSLDPEHFRYRITSREITT